MQSWPKFDFLLTSRMLSTEIIAYLITITVPALTIYLLLVADVFDTGKGSTIGVALLWGAIGAFGIAYILNNAVTDSWGYGVTVTRVAPPLEESLKALILVYLIRSPRFHYFIDGAIYGFSVGIGFAMSENIFFIAQNTGDEVLIQAVARVLSSSLMHASTTSVVGISLGLVRRSERKYLLPLIGMLFATVVHLSYNSILSYMGGEGLLLVAVVIGFGGGLLIFIFIDQGQQNEKKRFVETLRGDMSTAESKAIQEVGGDAIETVLKEAAHFFGEEKAQLIRRLLVKEANLGILKRNLESPVSDYLRQAWQGEIDELHAEIDNIQQKLGIYTMTFFLRNLLPREDAVLWEEFSQKVIAFEPEHIHAFDLYIAQAENTYDHPPDELYEMSTALKKVPFFEHVSMPDLENLSRAIKHTTYQDGTVIFDQGDEGQTMYIIETGQIDVYVEGHDGKNKLLRTFGVGEVIGELSLLDGQPRSGRAIAKASLRAMVLDRKHFNLFIQSRPQVLLSMLQYMAQRVRLCTEAIENSITWARNIAEGNYSQAQELAMSSALTQVIPPKTVRQALETGEFAVVAFKLEEREQVIRYKAKRASKHD